MERAIGAQEFFLLSMGNIILDFNGFNEWINLKFLQLAYKPGQANLKWPFWTHFEVVRGRTLRIREIWTTRKITLCPDMLYFDSPQEEKFEFQATRYVRFLYSLLWFRKKLFCSGGLSKIPGPKMKIEVLDKFLPGAFFPLIQEVPVWWNRTQIKTKFW